MNKKALKLFCNDSKKGGNAHKTQMNRIFPLKTNGVNEMNIQVDRIIVFNNSGLIFADILPTNGNKSSLPGEKAANLVLNAIDLSFALKTFDLKRQYFELTKLTIETGNVSSLKFFLFRFLL